MHPVTVWVSVLVAVVAGLAIIMKMEGLLLLQVILSIQLIVLSVNTRLPIPKTNKIILTLNSNTTHNKQLTLNH